jgi:hypothetical protein
MRDLSQFLRIASRRRERFKDETDMRTFHRPRHYVPRQWLVMGRPVLRYSESRDAYILRLVGRKWGPVLRLDRRSQGAFEGTERRGGRASVA